MDPDGFGFHDMQLGWVVTETPRTPRGRYSWGSTDGGSSMSGTSSTSRLRTRVSMSATMRRRARRLGLSGPQVASRQTSRPERRAVLTAAHGDGEVTAGDRVSGQQLGLLPGRCPGRGLRGRGRPRRGCARPVRCRPRAPGSARGVVHTNASQRLPRMFPMARDRRRACAMPFRSPRRSVTPADSMASSVPELIASPRSLTPSPAKATTRPSARSRLTTSLSWSGNTSASPWSIPRSLATASAVTRLSPVR
jgi:hypothetical protein